MLMDFVMEMWLVSASLAPWLLIGLFVAGLLHVFLPAGFIHRHLGGGGFSGTLKAVTIGVPMPLCSCGVIPAAIGLKKDGASDGAAVGFLISTPQTGVDSVAVSYAFLGLPFAIFKLLSAAVTGLVGGVLTDWIGKPKGELGDGAAAADASCELPTAQPAQSFGGRIKETFRFAFDELLYMIWAYILLGVLVSAALGTFLPADLFTTYGWTQGIWGMLLVLVISVPLYVCATSSVPIAAALVYAGMPAGAALVFLMAGPATNVATMGAIGRALGRRVLALYLVVIIGGSLLFGWLFDFVVPLSVSAAPMHEHGPSLIANLCIAVLALLLIRYAWQDLQGWLSKRRAKHAAGESARFVVHGMTCQGCVKKVREGLSSEPGISGVTVDLDSGETLVTGERVRQIDFPALIRKLGFDYEAPAR